MSWDDDEDDFYAAVDWDSEVQQARARQQQAAAAAPACGPPQHPYAAVQQQQQHPPPPLQAVAGLRSLFTGAAPSERGATPGMVGSSSVAHQPAMAAGMPARGPPQPGTGFQAPYPHQAGPPAVQWQPPPNQQPHTTAAQPPRQQQRQQMHGGQQHAPVAQGSGQAAGPGMAGPPGRPVGPSGYQQPPFPGPQQQQQHHYHQQQQQQQYVPAMAHSNGQASGGRMAGPPGRPVGPNGYQQPPFPGPQQQFDSFRQQPLPPPHLQPPGMQQQRPSGGAGSGPLAPHMGHAPAAASSGQGCGPLLFVNLELSKDQMIEVVCGYNETLSTAMKRIAGGMYDHVCRHWKFPVNQHSRIMQVLQELTTVRVKVEPLHPVVEAVLQATGRNPDDSSRWVRYCHIPSNLEQQLMPFQREGIKFALQQGGRALIGDEMGLGKTVQAIALASAYRDEWPVLIIAPSSLREAWADALHRWLGITEDAMHIVHSNKDAARVPKGISFLIVSYNFVQKMELGKQQFKVCILDECHFIKDPKAQRTKATVPLVKDARRAILLSGTPALNKPKEIFQQLAALVPGAKLKMKDFGERYCQGNYFDKFGGASNLPELNAMLKNSIMIRRLKREVLTQLPKKRRQQVMLTLDADAKKELAGLQRQLEVARQLMAEEARRGAASGGAAGGGSSRMEENKIITELYCKSAEVKAKAVQEHVQLLLDSGQKFLVFAHHASLLDAIEHTCNRHKGCKFIRIDGKTPSDSRQSLVNSFQENDDVRVAILSIRAAGTGLTLTAASTVVFAELTWTPGELVQAEDRAHRIGQASSVNIYFLHAKGSVDDLIWQSIQNKLDAVGEAIDGQAQALDARRTEAPQKGQLMLSSYMTQSRPEPPPLGQQQQQQQQAQQGAAADRRSPGKTQQTSLLNFFAAGAGRQPAQPQQPPQGPNAVPGPLYAPPDSAYQHQQQGPPRPYHQQQQQQGPPPPYHHPQQQQQQGPPPPYDHPQQQQQSAPPAPHTQQGAAYQKHHAPTGPLLQPLHAPSGRANVDAPAVQAQQPKHVVGTKRPYGA